MTKTELLDLIRNGENSGVEFKLDTIEPFNLAKEIVAFANFQGGVVLLGVADDGTIAGVTRADLEEWVMKVCRDKIRPEIIPYYEVIRDVVPAKDVAVVRVEPGYTVHHRWHDHHAHYYIRVGSTSREASVPELERLFQRRGSFMLDARPVSGTTAAELDRRRLRDYFERIREQAVPIDDDEAGWRSLLANTELLESAAVDSPATVASILLFGIRPKRYLPQSGISAVAFAGTDDASAMIKREELRGPLTPLLARDGAIVENGLVEQALAFCRDVLNVHERLDVHMRREEEWPYPPQALREIIVNALVHRDYLLSATDIQITIYSNSLEVISPGRLPNGVTPERMRTGVRAARNPMLKDIMSDYGYLEHLGMGIRAVVRLMREKNGTEPELVEDGERFIVRLRK